MIEFFRGAITTRQKIQNPRALMVSLIPSCLYVVLKVFFLGGGVCRGGGDIFFSLRCHVCVKNNKNFGMSNHSKQIQLKSSEK